MLPSRGVGEGVRSLENVELIKFTVSSLLMNDALATILAVYIVYGIQVPTSFRA